MVYLGFGTCFVLTGCALLTSKTGFVPGIGLPINFGEYKNVAGVFFIVFGALLFRAGLRALRNNQ
jgi:hypothetical protein